jgi:hypothetical protein
MFIGKTELSVSGRVLKIAKLRHEWFEYLDDPVAFIQEAKQARVADILTFLQEAPVERPMFPFQSEPASASVLVFKSFEDWWKNLNFKARNKARKAQKSGVELRPAKLDDEFVRGVEIIYNEAPLRQGRKFAHYGKDFATIKNDLSSFPDCTLFIGAYHENRLIGFMKLFEGNKILRTIHIIATFADRDKCAMDALIAKAVEIASGKNIFHLHYGDWAQNGLGAFREKFGFERHDCPRYFVPLNWRGKLALKAGLHRPWRERVPPKLRARLVGARNHWNAWRHGSKPAPVAITATPVDD